jgi:hypothetical protein
MRNFYKVNGTIRLQEVYRELPKSADHAGKKPDAASSTSSLASSNIDLDETECASPKTKDVKGTAVGSRKRKVNP